MGAWLTDPRGLLYRRKFWGWRLRNEIEIQATKPNKTKPKQSQTQTSSSFPQISLAQPQPQTRGRRPLPHPHLLPQGKAQSTARLPDPRAGVQLCHHGGGVRLHNHPPAGRGVRRTPRAMEMDLLLLNHAAMEMSGSRSPSLPAPETLAAYLLLLDLL